jgi:dephospho-CoA kinase
VFYGFEWVRTRNVIRDLLVDDAAAEPEKRLFERAVDPNAITENDLRECGAVILDKYKQIPLRRQLTKTVSRFDAPVVVDAIREPADVDRDALGLRRTLIWFVDCDDSIIRSRLAKRSMRGEKRMTTGSPVDRTAATIRLEADEIISNAGSLEELRWEVDNKLFELVSIIHH